MVPYKFRNAITVAMAMGFFSVYSAGCFVVTVMIGVKEPHTLS